MTKTQRHIVAECDAIRDLLLEKNRKYGDSALSPVRMFSKASPAEQILVRIDDKLSRMRSSQTDDDEDVVLDLIGYLVLLRVARAVERENAAAPETQPRLPTVPEASPRRTLPPSIRAWIDGGMPNLSPEADRREEARGE